MTGSVGAREADGATPDPVAARDWGVSRVLRLDEVDSTNAYLKRHAGACPSWTVVLADHQTAGRGRGAHRWWAPPGSGVLMSVLVPEGAAVEALPLRVGVAVAAAVEHVVPGVHCALKWPNDALVDGCKVAGILCETAGEGKVVVGVGVNVTQRASDFPQALRERATSLGLAARRLRVPTPEREDVIAALLSALRTALVPDHPWHRSWAERDALVGQPVAQGDIEGRAVGVDPDGALRIRTSDGEERRVVSGVVEATAAPPSLGRPGTGTEASCISS